MTMNGEEFLDPERITPLVVAIGKMASKLDYLIDRAIYYGDRKESLEEFAELRAEISVLEYNEDIYL